jgi:hypothetical protein
MLIQETLHRHHPVRHPRSDHHPFQHLLLHRHCPLLHQPRSAHRRLRQLQYQPQHKRLYQLLHQPRLPQPLLQHPLFPWHHTSKGRGKTKAPSLPSLSMTTSIKPTPQSILSHSVAPSISNAPTSEGKTKASKAQRNRNRKKYIHGCIDSKNLTVDNPDVS